MVQPLCMTVWWLLTELNIILLWCNSHVTWYLSKGVKNLCPYKNLHMDFYNSIIPIAKTWKQPACPSVG